MPYHQQDIIESSSDFKPLFFCPHCGAKPPIWEVGCSFQDCEECNDVEWSYCKRCGTGVGGASYWG